MAHIVTSWRRGILQDYYLKHLERDLMHDVVGRRMYAYGGGGGGLAFPLVPHRLHTYEFLVRPRHGVLTSLIQGDSSLFDAPVTRVPSSSSDRRLAPPPSCIVASSC